jgi:hypothetical protein
LRQGPIEREDFTQVEQRTETLPLALLLAEDVCRMLSRTQDWAEDEARVPKVPADAHAQR